MNVDDKANDNDGNNSSADDMVLTATETTFSPTELSLTDPLIIEAKSTVSQRCLTLINLKDMAIDSNATFTNPFYRRTEYQAQYDRVLSFFTGHFLITEDPIVQGMDFKVEHKDYVYEFTKASQPWFYFLVSFSKKGYQVLSNSTSNPDIPVAALANWPALLTREVLGASMVNLVVDKQGGPAQRCNYWIKFDMTCIQNPNYNLKDNNQLNSLTLTTSVFPIVTNMIQSQKQDTSAIKPAAPLVKPQPPVDYMQVDPAPPPVKKTAPPPQSNPGSLPKPVGRPRISLPGKVPEEPAGIKRTLPTPEPKPVEDSKPPPAKKRKTNPPPAPPVLTTPTSVAPSLPLQEPNHDLNQLLRDKGKLINDFLSLTVVHKIYFSGFDSAQMRSYNASVKGELVQTTQVLIDELNRETLSSVETPPEQDNEYGVTDTLQILDISKYMEDAVWTMPVLEQSIKKKKEAIDRGLICWLKAEVHRYLSDHQAHFLNDRLINSRNGDARSVIVNSLAKNPQKNDILELKQHMRQTRLAKVFHGAFQEFLNQVLHYDHQSRQKSITPLVSFLRDVNGLLKAHQENSKRELVAKSYAFDASNQSPLPKATDLKWIWPEEQTSDLAGHQVLEIQVVDTLVVVATQYYIYNPKKHEKEDGQVCMALVDIVSFLTKVILHDIPEHIEKALKTYNQLLADSGMDSVRTGNTFFFYLINGVFLGQTSTTATVRPFTELSDYVKKALLTRLIILCRRL